MHWMLEIEIENLIGKFFLNKSLLNLNKRKKLIIWIPKTLNKIPPLNPQSKFET